MDFYTFSVHLHSFHRWFLLFMHLLHYPTTCLSLMIAAILIVDLHEKFSSIYLHHHLTYTHVGRFSLFSKKALVVGSDIGTTFDCRWFSKNSTKSVFIACGKVQKGFLFAGNSYTHAKYPFCTLQAAGSSESTPNKYAITST